MSIIGPRGPPVSGFCSSSGSGGGQVNNKGLREGEKILAVPLGLAATAYRVVNQARLD